MQADIWGSTHTKMCGFLTNTPKSPSHHWIVTAIPAIPSGFGGTSGKQNTVKPQKLAWTTIHFYHKLL